MAYNRKNLLKRIIIVQEAYVKYRLPETTMRGVWREHIYPAYKISLKTLENYLATPAVAELKKLENGEQNQVAVKQVAMAFPGEGDADDGSVSAN